MFCYFFTHLLGEYPNVPSALLLLGTDEWAKRTVVFVGFDTHCYTATKKKKKEKEKSQPEKAYLTILVG